MKLTTAIAAWLSATGVSAVVSDLEDVSRTGALEPRQSKQPNFLVILTDDQDAQMNSLNYMDGVRTYLTEQGTLFNNHYCTVALCCPSRVNMWTGKAAHNTNVTDLQEPYGGYPKFIAEKWQTKWLPTWLKKAGYQTYFAGKLMNAHTIGNYKNGLNDMSLDNHTFMLQPGTYQYLNTTLQHDNEAPQSYPGLYATDLLANRSLDLLNYAATINKPWFLAINPVNPHENYNWSDHTFTAPLSAPRYSHLFQNEQVPRTDNFNPANKSGASWLLELNQLDASEVAKGDFYYRSRLQALQAVDDLVNRTVARLDQLNMLDNTFIIYTSDNGFHIGQHRLTPGKRCPYEEDVNVPMIIRGPGVPKGKTENFVTSHTDIVPSIVHWSGADTMAGVNPIPFDGAPIPLGDITNATREAHEHAFIEYWGSESDSQKVNEAAVINTYKAVRVIGDGYNLYYSVWCDGSHEIYDMMTDSGQMHNLINTTTTILGASITQLRNRLDTLTLVLKTCTDDTCNNPWSALQPNANVHTLKDALNPSYDNFYAGQPVVKFDHCPKGYFTSNEMPNNFNIYGNKSEVAGRSAANAYPWEFSG